MNNDLKTKLAYYIIAYWFFAFLSIILVLTLHYFSNPLTPYVDGFIDLIYTAIFSIPIWVYGLITPVSIALVIYIRRE